jgi:hypothetical protein
LAGLAGSVPAAPPAAAIVGSVSSTRPLTVDNVSMSPTGSASWPVVAGDEIATEASALLNTADHNVVVFDRASRAKLKLATVNPATQNQTYVFLLQGGLTFDARSSRLMICAAGKLFVPEKAAKGLLKLGVNGVVSERLDRGAFAENGTRGCDEAGPAQEGPAAQTGLPGAAGAVIPAIAGHTVGAAIAVAGAGAAAAGSAVAIGSAVAAANATTVSSTCADTGCNTNPPVVSTIQP